LRSVGTTAALILLILLWTIPVAFISSLISLDTVYKYLPSLGDFIDKLGPTVANTAKNIIPITVLSIWLSFLPDILQSKKSKIKYIILNYYKKKKKKKKKKIKFINV